MIKNIIYKKDGAALATVIIILAVIMVISMSVSMIFSNNLKQVKQQEHHMQSYYIALSGIELAYSALLTPIPDPITGEDKQLYESFQWDTDTYADIDDDLQEKFDTGNFPITDTVDIDGNNVQLTITPENRDGEREIKIQSLATLNSTGSTKSIILIFNAENELDRRWE